MSSEIVHTEREHYDQTAWMSRLLLFFPFSTCHQVCFMLCQSRFLSLYKTGVTVPYVDFRDQVKCGNDFCYFSIKTGKETNLFCEEGVVWKRGWGSGETASCEYCVLTTYA